MNFNPPLSATQNANTSSQPQSTGVRLVRGQPSAWGHPGSSAASRRGLTPLSTTTDSASTESGRTNSTSSPSQFTSSFSSILNSSSHRENSRSSQSFISSFPPIQTGSQQAQAGQLLLSPRSRAITPSSNPPSASSAAASTTASQVGGGGGSGSGGAFSRSQTFSPPLSQHSLTSPTASTFERVGYSGSIPSSSLSGQSSVSRIVDTQLFLLLGSITEKEGKVKWESQAEQIRNVLETHGMENFPKYFRRLLTGNAPQIFPGITRNVENPANYPILVREMEKITEDPQQASRIADAVDTSEGEIFRDFDLGTFMTHFRLSSLAKILLASALTHASRQDLKSKAAAFLRSISEGLAKTLANTNNNESDVPPILLATCALRYLHDSPPESITEKDYENIRLCLNHRYKNLEIEPPQPIQSLYTIMELDKTEEDLYTDVRKAGPKITSSLETAKTFLSDHSDWSLDENHVCGVMLLMSLSPDWEPYNVGNFVAAVQETSPSPIDWREVIKGFDRSTVVVSKPQFLTLYNALLPIAKSKPELDLQVLWGGPYKSMYTQLSILSSFFACSPSELDVTSIPNFRPIYEPEDLIGGPEGIAGAAAMAKKDAMMSLDAVTAFLDICIPVDADPTEQQLFELTQIVGEKVGLFICSATCLENNSPARHQLLRRLLQTYYLKRERSDYLFVLHTAWRLDRRFVAGALMDAHVADPLELTTMLELALELGWLEELLTMTTGFGFDLAALAHRKGLLDLFQWAEDKMSTDKISFVAGLSKFAIIKAQDELRISRVEQPEPRTVSLAMQSAYDMLAILDEHMADPAELKALQRTFLQAYPRLILLCEGISENIDVDCKQSNAMPLSADAEMQELYKRMYGKELDVSKVIEYLQECKESGDSGKKDLFACMIHGLFDEYSCFFEYPLDPLSKTAVLFGGIIQVGLISDLTLRVAREMVLDALSGYEQDASMFKFGLQALVTFAGRLREAEWIRYCKALLQIPSLQTTPVYAVATDALSQNGVSVDNGEPNGIDGLISHSSHKDLELDDIDHGGLAPTFKSVDPGTEIIYDEPSEEVKDKVVFFFNNVSQQNLSIKFEQLRTTLQEGHLGWFADFLVNGRAKVEPNYQPLYLEVLRLLGSKNLWNEVLRSTFSVIQKLLNSETTMQSASERKNLKSLAVWLGSLTIAQDKPVKRRNISIVDLLLEGYQFQKLLLIIPFICNVMAQGKHSTVFKPPNPWVMEILSALVEFYYEANITTNQKFDIEVLCDELSVKLQSIAPSNILSERAHSVVEQANIMMPEGMRTFETLSLGGINGNVQNPRFEVGAMQLELPDLERVLKFPPANGSAASQARLREVVIDAVTHAIFEIVGSVVERSVTIAAIAASNLIHKDFSCEEHEDRIRQAAQQTVRELASSLALVTSKDPLRTSMSNFIRKTQAEAPAEQAFPEGTILMCINDNLDIACEIVENKAADQALPEMEEHIEREIAARAQWRSEHPNEPYVGHAHSRWATAIPEPYKQTPNGLRPEQLAIYEDFGRQQRGLPNHAQTSSADSGRQLPDVLQDTYSSVSHAQAPADNMMLSHQGMQSQQYRSQRGRMMPPPLPAAITQGQVNGYRDAATVENETEDLLGEVIRIMFENDGRPFEELKRDTSLFEIVEQIKQSSLQYDSVAMTCAENICKNLYGEHQFNRPLAEIFVHILATLYQSYPSIAKEVAIWADMQNGEKMLYADVTIELLKAGILQHQKVDESLAMLIENRDKAAADTLSTIVYDLWQTSHPPAFRADFARSLGALAEWHTEDKDRAAFTDDAWNRISQIDKDETRDGTASDLGMVRKHQVNYVFSEWIRLCEENAKSPNDNMFAAFVVQAHLNKLLQSLEDVATFLRLCIDAIVTAFEFNQREEPRGLRVGNDLGGHFTEVDWLARLIVLLVRSQGEHNGAASKARTKYMDSVLSIITLIMNHHQVTRGDNFNQRVFFRLNSSILCDWYEHSQETPAQHEQMLLVFAENFLLMQPRYFPGFVYSWLGLVSHRLFLPNILKLSSNQANDAFARIVHSALTYVAQFLKPNGCSSAVLSLYSALLRVLLVLHHDYPAFLADAHFTLCNAVPAHATQLLNIISSACPPRNLPLPNPFTSGLKIDRLEEIREPPRITADYVSYLTSANVESLLDTMMRDYNPRQDQVQHLIDMCYVNDAAGLDVDSTLIHSIVLYIGENAIATANQRGSSAFVSDSPHAVLLRILFKEMRPDVRFQMISSMVNQLRWHNAHTHYFAYALLHLFGSDPTHQDSWDAKQQIIAVLLERTHTVLPHPWGLLVVLLELLKNPVYNFWQLPFVKSSPQIQAVCDELLKQGEEREQRWPPSGYLPPIQQ